MCIAVPMKITAVHSDGSGEVDLDGVSCPADLSLISNPCIGDYVVIHAGFAIEKLDPEDAENRLALFAELATTQIFEREVGV